jgi:septum formation protein
MALILASSSPRRRQLLRRAGIKFLSRPAGVDESLRTGETVEAYVRRMAREKARNAAERSLPGSLVLGADTAVEIAGQILGKPRNVNDAKRMLRLLSGKSHRVLTGICLLRAPGHIDALRHETTEVTFLPLSEDEIRRYVATREPFDKAGGYGIQGLASKFVRRIDGCFFNVMGLPLSLVYDLLRALPEWRNR